MRRQHWLAACVVALCVVAALGLPRLTANSHYSVYFDDRSPALVDHRSVQQEFSRADSLLILLTTEDGSFLDASQWFLLEDLALELAEAPHVRQLVSVTELNIPGSVETTTGQLIPDRKALADHGRVFGLLLSDDARTAALLLDVALPDYSPESVSTTLLDVKARVAAEINGHSVTAAYTGTLALNDAYTRVVRKDLRSIVPLLLGGMLVLLGVLLGGLRAVVALLPIGILAVVAAFGVAGWLGTELAAINSFVPIMVLSISIAGCVHTLLAYARERDYGVPRRDAQAAAVETVKGPMTLANGTTMLGFLALLLSPSPPIRVVGYTVAVGILVSWALCLTLLPALLERLDPRAPQAGRLGRLLRQLANSAIRRRSGVVAVALLVGVAATLMVSQNSVSDSVFDYFPDDHGFVIDTRVADEALAGVNELQFSIDTGKPLGVFDAATTETVMRFQSWLKEQPEVRQAVSLADTVEIRDAVVNNRLEQRLQSYARQFDANTARELRRELNTDASATLLTVFLDNVDSARIVAFDARAQNKARELFGDLDVTSAGATLIFAKLGEQNIRSMLIALSLGLLGATLLFAAVLRSGRVLAVALVCNVLPVLVVYGVWAVTDGRISIGAAVVMGMIMGIVIDDTVYLLTAWWRRRQALYAVADAVAEVGPALVVTTMTLAVGLSAGLQSDFRPVWSMSALSVGIILVALLVDLVVLPAMLSRQRA